MNLSDISYDFYPSSYTSAPSAPLIVVLDGVDVSFCSSWINSCPHACPILVLHVPNWDDNFTPWPGVNPFNRTSTFTGKSDAFLTWLTNTFLPQVLAEKDLKPTTLAICGYSLGGLFSCYALTHCNTFSFAASASGSFWYDDWVEYLRKLDCIPSPAATDCVNKTFYASLGEQEAYKKNGDLQLVGACTDDTLDELERLGILVPVFEFTQGTHIQNEDVKLKAACMWLDYELSHNDAQTIYIDADACPVIKETLALAKHHGMHVVIAGNTTQNLESHLNAHDPRCLFDATHGYWVETITTSIGSDSADFAIVESINPQDICVTQDIGLAAVVLGKDAHAISVRGKIFDKDTINIDLEIRHEEKKLRRQHVYASHIAKFTQTDRAKFSRKLNELIGKVK